MDNSNKPVGRYVAFRVAVAYVGCCIGAGFLSGQELWQFFGCHGKWQFLAIGVSVLLLFLAGALILSFAADSGESRMDRIVVWFDCKWLRAAVAVFEVVFLFLIYLLNVAAFGSLFEQIFGIPAVFGSVAFCVVATLVSVHGVRGLVRVFSLVVPLLVIVTLLVCALTVFGGGTLMFPEAEVEGLLIGSPVPDGVTYAVFSLFCALPVLVPLGKMVPSGRSARRGIFFGCLFLGFLIVAILLSIATTPEVATEELPMLALAFSKNAVMGYIFAFLLVFGIFSAGLSSQSAMNEYFVERFPKVKRYILPLSAGISLAALLLGLFGFKRLVGMLYPLLGYVGIIPLVLLVVHACVYYRKKRGAGRADTEKNKA